MMHRERPALVEPAPRYWRRRANRRVRKERFARTVLRWSVIGVLNVIIGLLLLQAGVQLFRRITTSRYLAVERVEVVGAHRASTAAVLHALDGYRGRNILDLNLYEVAESASRDRWIQRVAAKRILPGTLRVTVTERRPGAIAVVGGVAQVVDSQGRLVGPLRPDAGEDLPALIGLDRLQGETLQAALVRGVGFVERLRALEPRWARTITELDLSRGDRVTARLSGGGPGILLDPERIERNVRHYLALRPEIEERIGSAKYVDLRWRDVVSAMPAHGAESREGG